MAEFAIREVEGIRQVSIPIDDETVRAGHRALSNRRGRIAFLQRLPRLGDAFRSIFTGESRVRAFYSGTGTILLQPSLHGYHLMALDRSRWTLEPGGYCARDGSVHLELAREPFFAGLWAGDGLLVWKRPPSPVRKP